MMTPSAMRTKLARKSPVTDLPGVDSPTAIRVLHMHTLRTLLILTAVTGFLAAPAVAQNAPDRWRSQLELGFNGSSGNSSFGILRTGASVKRLETDLYEFELSGLVRYGKSEERVIADDQRGTIKFDWKPDTDFSPFAFVSGSRDQIRRIDLRLNSGAGAKWTFWRGANPEATKASLSLAGVVDYENFNLATTSTAAETKSALRWSARLKLDHTFGSGATIEHVTFYQPQIDSFGDYVIEMTNTLSTRLLSNLSLAIQHEYLHDEVPPPDTEPNDQKFSVVLRVSL